MNFTDALNKLSRDELMTIQAEHYTYNDPNINQQFYNYIHDLVFLDDRLVLCKYYNITTDDFGNYTHISHDNALGLLKESLDDASKYLIAFATSHYGPSDDDTDYLNAARDQVNFIIDTIIDDDQDYEGRLLACINYRNDATEPDYNFEGFRLGYADFVSVISTLARTNDPGQFDDNPITGTIFNDED